ncbi:TPA: hypothetical protein QCO08_005529 [Bacillus anthracis]|nr:hypothetical protein [Bacillus anthracis]
MNKRKHPLYTRWYGMMYRCYRPTNGNYYLYGGRGVTVAERWHDFWNFVHDVDNHLTNGHLLYKKGYQLDKDLKGGMIYSLETCVVMTTKDNNNLIKHPSNQKKEILAITDNDDEIIFESISEASKQLNIKRTSIKNCLNRGHRNKTTGYRFKYL